MAGKNISKRHIVHLRIFKRPFNYWYPSTDIVQEIVKKYRDVLTDGSIVVLSEKAVSVALGNIYDENLVKSDLVTKYATQLINKYLWGRILYRLFQHGEEFLKIVMNIPVEFLASHKKLTLRYGGLIHFIKPFSEAGIDATNLPYFYVSLPLRNADKIIEEIRNEAIRKLGKDIAILLVDTDKTFKPKKISCIAISTRPSYIKGIIDLGGLGYIIGRTFKSVFSEYPTPVAYKGIWLGLPRILKITKLADRAMGHGLGRTVIEMLKKLKKKNFEKVTWSDMRKIKHYPAIIITISFTSYRD